MIKNIIFDLGNVLVDFDWQGVFRKLGLEGQVCDKVAKATVMSSIWDEYDKGAWSDEEVLASFIKSAPEYEVEVRLVWDHIADMIVNRSYTEDWLRELKEQGYGCYYLSNYPERTYLETKDKLGFFSLMDGGILSYAVKMAKPDPRIYQLLLEKYDLKAQECIFFDDKLKNVEGAKDVGIHGIQFFDMEQGKKEMKKWQN